MNTNTNEHSKPLVCFLLVATHMAINYFCKGNTKTTCDITPVVYPMYVYVNN